MQLEWDFVYYFISFSVSSWSHSVPSLRTCMLKWTLYLHLTTGWNLDANKAVNLSEILVWNVTSHNWSITFCVFIAIYVTDANRGGHTGEIAALWVNISNHANTPVLHTEQALVEMDITWFPSPLHLIGSTAHQWWREQKEGGMEVVKAMDGSCLTTKELGCAGLFLHQACLRPLDPIFI